MLAFVRHGVLSQPRTGAKQFSSQRGIDLCLTKRGLPASLGENRHCLASREVPGPEQNRPRRDLERGVDSSCNMARIHVPCVGHDTTASRRLFSAARTIVVNLTSEFV